eukprot:360056-Chlamydomonas_euryale.AAC.22
MTQYDCHDAGRRNMSKQGQNLLSGGPACSPTPHTSTGLQHAAAQRDDVVGRDSRRRGAGVEVWGVGLGREGNGADRRASIYMRARASGAEESVGVA